MSSSSESNTTAASESDRAPATSGWLIWMLAFLALWAGFVGVSVKLCGNGFIHPETHTFLPHYLSGRPMLELIYDNQATEWGHYQARELAFVFDYMDSQFIAWSAEHGHPHLFSACHYLMLLLAGFALWRICAKYLGLDRFVALGFVALLWFAPTAMLYTSFYRGAKVAVLTASLCTMWTWFSIVNDRRGGLACYAKYVLFALCAFAMPMVDKIGLAFLCILCGFLACRWWRSRARVDASLVMTGGAALGMAFLYGWWIGPALTIALNHYPAETGYSSLPIGEIVREPKRLAFVVIGGFLFTLDSFRIVLGNLPAGLALGVGWAVWYFLPREGAGLSLRRFMSPAWLFAIGALAIYGLFVVMLLRFEEMFSNEHRRVFYSYPVAGFWLVVVAAGASFAIRRFGISGIRVARVAVVLAIVGSLYAIQEHRFVMKHGKYEPFFANAESCFAALRPEALAEAKITREEAAALLAKTPRPDDGVIADVRQNRVYLVLAARMAKQ
jgi:hypothetical protein